MKGIERPNFPILEEDEEDQLQKMARKKQSNETTILSPFSSIKNPSSLAIP